MHVNQQYPPTELLFRWARFSSVGQKSFVRQSHHELPAGAYIKSAEPLPADFRFNASEPPPDPDFKESGGRFVKGRDPRRHTLTPAECSAGFWAGLASYAEKGGDPRNFLRRKMGTRGQAFRPVPKAERGRLAA